MGTLVGITSNVTEIRIRYHTKYKSVITRSVDIIHAQGYRKCVSVKCSCRTNEFTRGAKFVYRHKIHEAIQKVTSGELLTKQQLKICNVQKIRTYLSYFST
jgi:hypothetical protein